VSCFCAGEVAWDTGVQNTLDFTLYDSYVSEGNAANDPEDLDGKTFSALVYKTGEPTTIYATAIGSAFSGAVGKVQVLDVDSVSCRILVTFPAAATSGDTWENATFAIHDITSTSNPIKRIEGTVRLKQAAAPVIA